MSFTYTIAVAVPGRFLTTRISEQTDRPIGQWLDQSVNFTRLSSIHFRRWGEFTSERWYCISEVNAMFRKTYEYNRSKYRIKTNPESETNRVTVTFLHACHVKIRYLTCWIISDSDIIWIVVESSQGMKSFYFEEANCTVLASYFHIRKGSMDLSREDVWTVLDLM